MDDWEVKYNCNRFAWLGNGYSQTELDPTADWAFYIREKDDDEPLSRGRKLQIINRSGTMSRNVDQLYGKRDAEEDQSIGPRI